MPSLDLRLLPCCSYAGQVRVLNSLAKIESFAQIGDRAWLYLQFPLQQWGVGNVYLLVLSSWKVNIAENPIAVMEL